MSPDKDSKGQDAVKKKLEDYLFEGTPQVPQPAPKAQEKEEEKKKPGAALPGSAGSGGAASGAVGSSGAGLGSSAAAGAGWGRAAAIAVRGAASPVGASLRVGFPGWLGKIGAILLGKTALFTYAAAVVLGVGAAVASRPPSAGQSPIMRRIMADLRSAIPVHKVTDDMQGMSLSMFADALKKEFGAKGAQGQAGPGVEPGAGPAEPEAAGQPAAQAQARGESPGVLADGRQFVQPRLRSSGLGSGGSFGGQDIFAKGGTPRFGENFDRGKIRQFQAPPSAKTSGGKLTASRSTGSSYARVKGLDRSSRSLAQLRGMKTWNPSLRAGGTRASEANREAAIGQFEGATVEGGGAVPAMPDEGSMAQVPATPSGVGNTGSTTGTTGDVQDITQCSDQEYWDGSACKSIYATDPGENVTPWQDKADQARDLILAGAVLGLLAGILYSFKDAKPYGAIFEVLAYICLIACIACAIAAIVLGYQINQMGGSPQGTLDIVAGIAVIIGALLAMFSKKYDTYGYVILAIVGICELVAMML
ncbi:MAG: hypothetical protein HY926_11925 [Elusimicrobia bacterium]|nr:hypothetical protein [Elusimicrobiota bacterium]